MTTSPSTEDARQIVDKFLLPHEREGQVIIVRRHPAVLITPVATTVGGLFMAVTIEPIAQGDQSLQGTIWLLWGILLLRLMAAVFNWTTEYFVATDQRLILVSGVYRRRTESMPLAQVNDMSLRRSLSGSLFGYGTLIFESADRDAVIEYTPYPEQIYLEIANLLFPGRAGQRDD